MNRYWQNEERIKETWKGGKKILRGRGARKDGENFYGIKI